ncbi:hypothetical protein P3T27_008132 [Kitasatospora sp. MAA19]|uniref:DUF6192 family protein n=1 Tax=Kitasatospora sp. MAA19 TaxID=3035090 RepID=UPI002474B180|nr:DUF6192 family protein [Kitasatospora sp. MAA19]MDH6711374.1 hypothetical protein [Kitasatospora sp. MAA19]
MPAKTIESPFPKQFTDRQWVRYVRQGRDLVEEGSSIQFRLGDLTLKMIPALGREAGNRGVFMVLDRFADEIGINVHTLIEYRHQSTAWPPDKRAPGVSWSIHRSLDAVEDRFDVIHNPPDGERWTEDKALRFAGRLPNRPLTKTEKLDRVRTLLNQDEYAAEAVSEMLKRPNVAHQVMANRETQRIVYRAHHEQRLQAAQARFTAAHEHEQEEEVEEPVREVRRREPAVDYTRASAEVLELIGMGTTFLVEMQRLIPNLHIAEFTDREVRAILDNHRRIRAALDWCDTVVTTGEKSMDDELARILGEGDDLE